MPSVSNRLTGGEIKKILRQGKHQNNQFLTISWHQGGKAYKRAIIVSKDVDKRAVTRNRLRRIISEELRKKYNCLQGRQLVIKIKKASTGLGSIQLRKELKDLLNKSKII